MKTFAVHAIAVVLLSVAIAGEVSAQNDLIQLGKKVETNRKKTDANGKINFDVKNTMNIRASDIHFKIVNKAPNEDKIQRVVSDEEVFDNHWPVPPAAPPNAEGGADGGWVDEKGGDDDQVSFELTIVDKNGQPVNQREIQIEVWWTRFGNAVTMFSPDGIGAEGGSTALLSAVIPDYNASPVAVTLGAEALICNDIAIGETFQYRFEQGSLVVKPSNGRFTLQDDTAVKGFNEDGVDVTGTGAFSVSNVRINDHGYLVFEVSRDRTAELHIAIVIRNLKLTGLDAAAEPHQIHASFSGAAISGECAKDLIHIATVQQEE